MKKLFQNQYFLAATIIGVSLGAYWVSTKGNKKWLLNQLQARQDVTEEILKTYETKTTSELRKILKEKQG